MLHAGIEKYQQHRSSDFIVHFESFDIYSYIIIANISVIILFLSIYLSICQLQYKVIKLGIFTLTLKVMYQFFMLYLKP